MLEAWGLTCCSPAGEGRFPSPQGSGAWGPAPSSCTQPADSSCSPAFLLAALYLKEPSFCPHDVPEVPGPSRSFWRLSQCLLLAPSASRESLGSIRPCIDNEGLSHTLPCWHFNLRAFGSVSDYPLLESEGSRAYSVLDGKLCL